MMKQGCGLDRNNVLRPTPRDPWVSNTGGEKKTVEPWWAQQQTKMLRLQAIKINSFMLGPSLSLTPDPTACN